MSHVHVRVLSCKNTHTQARTHSSERALPNTCACTPDCGAGAQPEIYVLRFAAMQTHAHTRTHPLMC